MKPKNSTSCTNHVTWSSVFIIPLCTAEKQPSIRICGFNGEKGLVAFAARVDPDHPANVHSLTRVCTVRHSVSEPIISILANGLSSIRGSMSVLEDQELDWSQNGTSPISPVTVNS